MVVTGIHTREMQKMKPTSESKNDDTVNNANDDYQIEHVDMVNIDQNTDSSKKASLTSIANKEEKTKETNIEETQQRIIHSNRIYSFQFRSKPFGMVFAITNDKKNLYVKAIDEYSPAANGNVIVGSILIKLEDESVENLGAKIVYKTFKQYSNRVPLRITFQNPFYYQLTNGEDIEPQNDTTDIHHQSINDSKTGSSNDKNDIKNDNQIDELQGRASIMDDMNHVLAHIGNVLNHVDESESIEKSFAVNVLHNDQGNENENETTQTNNKQMANIEITDSNQYDNNNNREVEEITMDNNENNETETNMTLIYN